MSAATGPPAQIRDPVDALLPPAGAAVRSYADESAQRGLKLCDPRLSELSTTVTALARDYGRTPASATSWRLDESCVVTALEDFLTPAERAFVEDGDARLVQCLRSAFVEAIADEYTHAAENALGREVIAHRSHVVCGSNLCLEIFVLGKTRGVQD